MKTVTVHSHHSRRLTIFKIKKEGIGENQRNHINLFSLRNVIAIWKVKRRFTTMSMKISDL